MECVAGYRLVYQHTKACSPLEVALKIFRIALVNPPAVRSSFGLFLLGGYRGWPSCCEVVEAIVALGGVESGGAGSPV